VSTLTIHEGDVGASGTDGKDGLDASNTNADRLVNPILDCLQPNTLSKSAFVEFNRASVSPYTNRYNKNIYSLPSTATNFNLYSEDFTQWDDVLSQWSIIGATTDPFGGSNATEIELDADTRNPVGVIPVMGRTIFGLTTGIPMVASFYIKRISGSIDTVEYSDDSDYFDLRTISDSWERKVIKIGTNSASSGFGISPRGDSGARFAVYGVQLQDDVLTDYIPTNGIAVTTSLNGDVKRESEKGYLIEGAKQNLCRNTQDFAAWSVVDGQVITNSGQDAFGFYNALTLLSFSSLPIITLSTATEALTQGVEYNVSFYAFNAGGSLTSLNVSLGDGDDVLLPQPSVSGFARISVKVTAGIGDTITIKAESAALTAQLNMGCFQIEEGELSTYIASGSIGQSRDLDLVSMAYEYNAPLPSGNWSFVFGKDIPNDSNIKTIFSNGESGSNEFSLSYQNRLLTLNNGGNTADIDLFDYPYVAITYDGANVKFYGGNSLVSTAALSSTSFIASSMYIGSDGSGNAINGLLSGCLFYNETLSDNDVLYLLGV
jgi:hypothetical protein